MTADVPDRALEAFESHDAFERAGEWFAVTTTAFDARATAEATDGAAPRYTLEVRAPTLQAATADEEIGRAHV